MWLTEIFDHIIIVIEKRKVFFNELSIAIYFFIFHLQEIKFYLIFLRTNHYFYGLYDPQTSVKGDNVLSPNCRLLVSKGGIQVCVKINTLIVLDIAYWQCILGSVQ